MAVTGIGNHTFYQNPYSSQKKEATEKTELENTKSSNVSDYSQYLSKKYDCVKNGNVAISGTYLRECANNPEKAQELEQNLSFYNESCRTGYESAKANASAMGAKLVDYSENWSIDSKGNITMIASTTVTSGNDVKKQEQTKRLEQKKEKVQQQEKLKQKRAEQKKIQQMRIEKAKNKNNMKNINFKV